MKLNKTTAALICILEYIIASSCYNPKSYNGYTGEEGCSFRYPVSIFRDTKEKYPAKCYGIVSGYSSKMILTMKYIFGANHLLIGEGIYNVLDHLEKRYNLDFNELEKEYQKSLKSK